MVPIVVDEFQLLAMIAGSSLEVVVCCRAGECRFLSDYSLGAGEKHLRVQAACKRTLGCTNACPGHKRSCCSLTSSKPKLISSLQHPFAVCKSKWQQGEGSVKTGSGMCVLPPQQGIQQQPLFSPCQLNGRTNQSVLFCLLNVPPVQRSETVTYTFQYAGTVFWPQNAPE